VCLSLQRSEMFIDNALYPITRAPAERNDYQIRLENESCFAPLERGEFLAVARSINISPRRGEGKMRSKAPLNCGATAYGVATNDN
jgi:hypothetical protein